MIEEFLFFHDFALIVLTFITVAVFWVMLQLLYNKFVFSGLIEGQTLEAIWTFLPAIVLLHVAVPSLMLLYLLEESTSADLSVNATGHQWYWSYEVSDISSPGSLTSEDSYMDQEGNLRLLDVDNRLCLPFSLVIRMLVTSQDVLHSWALPSFGIKADACPGRLNQVIICAFQSGVFYGQCSEICGNNHSFIPISLEIVSPLHYLFPGSLD